MRVLADQKGVDLLVIDTGDRIEGRREQYLPCSQHIDGLGRPAQEADSAM